MPRVSKAHRDTMAALAEATASRHAATFTQPPPTRPSPLEVRMARLEGAFVELLDLMSLLAEAETPPWDEKALVEALKAKFRAS